MVHESRRLAAEIVAGTIHNDLISELVTKETKGKNLSFDIFN